MRKGSLQTQTSEPLIVVEEPGCIQEPELKTRSSSEHTSEDESPMMNPYLLSPWSRETRKHSLPTPQCSGITASQVRRLSERGEGAPGPRQTEFLATLSSAPAPSPGGRRHSVVTISKVPSAFFGRNRRESVAGRILPSRRESVTGGPPSTEPRGSVHNLQLDIMDDIVQARKVRMKLWNTSSNEKVCEVQPLDDEHFGGTPGGGGSASGGIQRYASSRRYSDFVGTTLAPIPSATRRRASELPPPSLPPRTSSTSSTACKITSSGIICTNTDLISILSSSAMEINHQQCEVSESTTPMGAADATSMEENKKTRRSRLKTSRSNSFDVSTLPSNEIETPSNWFIKRHQPISTKNFIGKSDQLTSISFADEKKSLKAKDSNNKVLWDERSGSLVDAQLLGTAIQDFLKKSSPEKNDFGKGDGPSTSSSSQSKSKSGWFSNKPGDENNSNETSDSSLCSTLKDLFVK
ncbi:uncharacterized protein [Onthophagus taurus]|uniref:uncharacterized protein n=1 Tax=Onthophagus taurus TaxID=166361 RepID=UPI000C1FE15E|nr:uncharacterized protein LOC111428114 [Onthophagus taurus]XP_022919283.1 uncharacterized protein LOC111428114 [Onthophagus taurus]XP_022919284.1 uncharacterized protein LOC111428114 [Onthophagus taurus]XP_022919285.1 uncharacterized protein LOC111428114 [Onthophagus taurus]